MVPAARFNTLHCELYCPHCKGKIVTGLGFRVGSLENRQYRLGDNLNWHNEPRRPSNRPAEGNIITLGHFNCDNPRCASWQDCYPNIQTAKITIKKDKIVDVVIYTEAAQMDEFAILES